MNPHTSEQGSHSYRSLAVELAIDFVIMYLVMYTMIAALVIGAAVHVFGASFAAMRSQDAVGNREFLRSMICHTPARS